ncbi:PDR/VanB family oxidoreductase [Microbacterium sp. GXF7504]
MTSTLSALQTVSPATGQITALVTGVREIAADVLQITLEPTSGRFPEWAPGAHVDVILPDGTARQYSLAGSPTAPTWTLGVLIDRQGRGGSVWIAENARPGTKLTLSTPRNHFPFSAEPEVRPVFVAGGIGITPLLPMIEVADAAGLDWAIHYVGRSMDHMPYADELSVYTGRVHLYPRDTSARPDLDEIIRGHRPTDVYCCGPETLMAAVENLGRTHEDIDAHVERFIPRPLGDDRGLDEFDVHCEYTGIDVHVGPGQSILNAVAEAGIEAPASCAEGTCGTCETPIISGEVVHLDSVLSDAERQASCSMMICVSRAACPRIVLDI